MTSFPATSSYSDSDEPNREALTRAGENAGSAAARRAASSGSDRSIGATDVPDKDIGATVGYDAARAFAQHGLALAGLNAEAEAKRWATLSSN